MPYTIIIEKLKTRIDELFDEIDIYDTEVCRSSYGYIADRFNEKVGYESLKSKKLARCFGVESREAWNDFNRQCDKP